MSNRVRLVEGVPDLRPWTSRAWTKVVRRSKEIIAVTTALGVLGVSIGGISAAAGAAALRYMGVARTADINRLDTGQAEIKQGLGEVQASLKQLAAKLEPKPTAPLPQKPTPRRRRPEGQENGK